MLKKILVASGLSKSWPSITAEEVYSNPYFIVAGNSVYNVAPILGGEHPGGDQCLLRRGGGAMDCTRDLKFHSPSGRKKWESFKVAELDHNELMKLEERHKKDGSYSLHNATTKEVDVVSSPSSACCRNVVPLSA